MKKEVIGSRKITSLRVTWRNSTEDCCAADLENDSQDPHSGQMLLRRSERKWIPGDSIDLQDMLKAGYAFSKRKGKVIKNSKKPKY